MNTTVKPSFARNGDWFQTYTGRAIYLIDPRPDEICLEDIAHGLANLCRFNGHVSTFYSVAQHSIFVSEIVPPHLALQALMHDATEAYLGDMVKPLKNSMPAYRSAEDYMWACICAHFNLPVVLDPAVKHADLVALATEREQLMARPPMRWDIDEQRISAASIPLLPVLPPLAEHYFLERFRQLTLT